MGILFIGLFVYDADMAEQLLADNSTLRKRRLLAVTAVLLILALGSAYAVTRIARMDGNTLYGSRGRSFHAAIHNARGLQYITTGNIDLEGRNRHYQQIYLLLSKGYKAPAKALAEHLYHQLLTGGWPHEINTYVKSILGHGTMYIYKAMNGPAEKFIWVAAMRHGRVVNLISYTGNKLDLPLDEQEFDTLVQWVQQNQPQ